jgi:hypothetical protein
MFLQLFENIVLKVFNEKIDNISLILSDFEQKFH